MTYLPTMSKIPQSHRFYAQKVSGGNLRDFWQTMEDRVMAACFVCGEFEVGATDIDSIEVLAQKHIHIPRPPSLGKLYPQEWCDDPILSEKESPSNA